MASIEQRRERLLLADGLAEQGQMGLSRASRLLRDGIAMMEAIAADPHHRDRQAAVAHLASARPELEKGARLATEARELRRFVADSDAALEARRHDA